MILFILKMDKGKAREICNWEYPEPYNMYNMNVNEERINELLNGSYYAAIDENNELVGFYCFGKCAQVPYGNDYNPYRDASVIDIGLGLRPDLCGKGNGFEFLRKCTVLGQNLFSSKNFRLTVAEFNKRAIAVYKKFGFKEQCSFERINNNQRTKFITMTCTID